MKVPFHLGRRVLIAAAALMTATVLSGCGPKFGKVSGKVMVNNTPVAGGMISFVGFDGMPRGATIADDGSYTVDAVIYGENVVTVTGAREELTHEDQVKAFKGSEKPDDQRPVGDIQGKPKGVLVPAKYEQVHSTDLRFTVDRKEATYSPELK